MNDFARELLEEGREWEGLTTAGRDGAEVAFLLDRREVGHLHEASLHVPFPRPVRDEVIASGTAEVHPFNPDTGWVEVPLESESDLEDARSILERSYNLAVEANNKKGN